MTVVSAFDEKLTLHLRRNVQSNISFCLTFLNAIVTWLSLRKTGKALPILLGRRNIFPASNDNDEV